MGTGTPAMSAFTTWLCLRIWGVTFFLEREFTVMEVIAIANQKGGCGKTTTTVNLAAYLALRGSHVLLIDLNPQGSATTHLGIDKDNLPKNMNEVMMDRAKLEDIIIPTTVKGLDIAPTNNDLVEADAVLTSKVEFFAAEGLKTLIRMLDELDELGYQPERRYLLTMCEPIGRFLLQRGQAVAQALKSPKISLYSPPLLAVLESQQLMLLNRRETTLQQYRKSTKARELVENALREAYPELCEKILKRINEGNGKA
jgi:cellulose biosynthesis protein BcsQ